MVIKKVSVISLESIKVQNLKLQKHWDNYWMHKFRNVTLGDITDASKRTTLQSHFASSISMCNTIPNTTFTVIWSLFGHKFKARSRVLAGLGLMTLCFATATIFVEINTDSWQVLLFVITMATLAVINAANATLQVAILVVLAKFPPRYMKFYLFGEGCAAVFNAILQIITLAVGSSTIASGLIYFILGTSLMGLTFIIFYCSNKNEFYTYFVEHFEGDTTRDMLSFSEIKAVLKLVWPSILIYILYDFAKLPHTPVTTLIVSENYGNGNPWNDIYFVPVITFLLGDTCTLLGRLASSVGKGLRPSLILVFASVRIIIFLPLVFFCNAQPRKHLPVLLGHDWEYILLQITYAVTGGYLQNMMYLSVHRLMEPEKVADGYLVLLSSICIIGASLSPLSTFSYWMHKFRNVTLGDITDASKRTTLQSHFTSSISMCNSIPTSTFIVLSSLFGHKFKARSRILGGLGVMTVCFAIATIFVETNTDSWQVLFFVVTMATLATINAANATLQVAVLVLLAKFPSRYMKFYLFGEGCAAVFNAILQIITLAVGTSTITSALIYFILGTSFMGLTFILFHFTNKNEFYNYFVEHFENDATRDMLSLSEIKHVLKLIWPCILIYIFYDFAKLPQTPVTTLVVSENYGSGNPWSDIYFVPVITFLLGEFSSLLGRLASSAGKGLPPSLVLVFSCVNLFFLPLIFLCNAQPRKHLPVWLGHDWEYILVQVTFCFTAGYLFNMIFLSVNRLIEPEKVADGYLVLISCICVLGALLSPLSTFSVDLL
ncbi:hypothetical protein NQ315_005189 [Exocentrus adspersus]|uniref:Uncharacterized protein n=1 Tax=Exocentrus adspersus TaxID=1586481 RepID=A0AAV8VU39_9CUCU|nr:hypothetical protein NQ315_005189 [Exocentrus adspersus]